jgi:hypothetical protein
MSHELLSLTGSKKQAAGVGTPVRDVTTAEPPVRSIAVTLFLSSARLFRGSDKITYRIFVNNPKTIKVRCA